MNSGFSTETPRLCRVAVLAVGVFCGVSAGFALTENNPYAAIGGRNVFALKPPVAVTNIGTAAVTAPAGLELQGFTTILGRPQVLIKMKVPPRPPEPAKDRSLVMDVGQREGDVEIVEMDTRAGIVKLKNQGNLVSLNLKDNSSKLAPGPALPAPPVPQPAGMIPPPASGSLAPGGGGVSTSTMGGSSSGGAGLPTRSIRTPGGVPQASSGYGSSAGNNANISNLSREEQAALILANKEKWRQQGREDIANLLPNPIQSEPAQK